MGQALREGSKLRPLLRQLFRWAERDKCLLLQRPTALWPAEVGCAERVLAAAPVCRVSGHGPAVFCPAGAVA